MNFFRKTALFLLVLSVLAACGSFVSQYVLGMNPCVLCIVQRLCVLAVGVAALLAVFFRQSSKVGRTFSALLISAPAVYGIGTAAYQLWLQSLPPGTAPSCGAPWTFRLKDWPLFDWFEPSCAASVIAPYRIIFWVSRCRFGALLIFVSLSYWFGLLG